ncbi:MAG: hypothetical protein LBS62_02905 [Clostridiales bacterium]|nr:hypothetical protein [Clostridiales bacterium]
MANIKALRQNPRVRAQFIIAAVLLSLFVAMHFVSGFKLLSPGNVKLLITQSVFPAFVSWGMMFIFTSGIVDLSVGANCILSANVGVLLAQYLGLGYPGLILGTVLAAVALEQLTIFCAVTLKIPSWIAGLGMALVMESATTVGLSAYLSGTNILWLDEYRALGTFPAMLAALILGAAVSMLISDRTAIGCNIRAVGGSPHVSGAMGIDAKRTVILGAVIGAAFFGIGSVFQVSYASKFIPVAGLGSLSTIFNPLAVVLLSGSFARYINTSVGVLVGSVLVTSIFNMLTLLGVPSGTWQQILLGAIVVTCGMISGVHTKGVVK